MAGSDTEDTGIFSSSEGIVCKNYSKIPPLNLKRALLICTGAYHTEGGIAAVNRLVIKAIAENGYSLDIFSLIEKDTTIDARYLPSGAQVHCRAFARNKYLFTLAVWWAILQHSYTYVCVDHVNLASILAPLARLKRCNYVVWLCGIEVFSPRPDREGRLGLMGAWKRLAISEFTRQSVTNRFPDLPVIVCDLSLDPVRHANILQPSLSTSSFPAIVLEASDGSRSELGDQVILNVGRMTSSERYKGQDTLIRAFPIIYQQNPGVQLVLAGQGDDMPRLKGLTQTLSSPMQARIFFPGYVPNDLIDLIYKKCYVFAMPSIGEGFGLVYLEAMMRAKPCLGGQVDATPCVVRDGLTGLLVNDPKSPEQVAEVLNWFLSHPEETRRMGLAGYDLVQSYYLFPHFQDRFWKALLV
jgi:phosphatidyl-myo-inositol dimannoside synthase